MQLSASPSATAPLGESGLGTLPLHRVPFILPARARLDVLPGLLAFKDTPSVVFKYPAEVLLFSGVVISCYSWRAML